MFDLLIMSGLLGASSFGIGILPLSMSFSKSSLEQLSAIGTGLLLGAALGVILPEGIESTVSARPQGAEVPTGQIALALLCGFTFMLVVEQVISPNSHSHDQGVNLQPVKDSHSQNTLEFDAELGELEHNEGAGGSSGSGYRQIDGPNSPIGDNPSPGQEKAFPLTFGLVVHALTDGLALGVSLLPSGEAQTTSRLSIVVFLALIIHKAPTALALTTSLLATSLPRTTCKKHLAAFSCATPVGAVLTYLLLSFLGGSGGGWTGIALLVSAGTFLYVATVLQPVSHASGSAPGGPRRPSARVFLIAGGMFVPFCLSTLLGHGH